MLLITLAILVSPVRFKRAFETAAVNALRELEKNWRNAPPGAPETRGNP
jgi:hypothetical protein